MSDSDTDLLALLWRTTARVAAKANKAQDETVDAVGDMADAAARVFTRLLDD